MQCLLIPNPKRISTIGLLISLIIVKIADALQQDGQFTAKADKETVWEKESVVFKCPADHEERFAVRDESSPWKKDHKLLNCGWFKLGPAGNVTTLVETINADLGPRIPSTRYQKYGDLCDFKIKIARVQDSGTWLCFMDVETTTLGDGKTHATHYSRSEVNLTVKAERLKCNAAPIEAKDKTDCNCPSGYVPNSEQQCTITCKDHWDCSPASVCVDQPDPSISKEKVCTRICAWKPCGSSSRCRVLPAYRQRDCVCEQGTVHLNETHCVSDRPPVALNLLENGEHRLRITAGGQALPTLGQMHSGFKVQRDFHDEMKGEMKQSHVIIYLNQGQSRTLGCLAEDASPVTRLHLWNFAEESDFPDGYATITFTNVSLDGTELSSRGLTEYNFHEELVIDTRNIRNRRIDTFSCGFRKFAKTLDVDVVVSACHSEASCGQVTRTELSGETYLHPEGSDQPADKLHLVKPGSTLKLSCDTDLHMAVKEKDHCIWMLEREGEAISQRKGVMAEKDSRGMPSLNRCELELKDVQLKDSGQWFCQVLLDHQPEPNKIFKNATGEKIAVAVVLGPDPIVPTFTLHMDNGVSVHVDPSNKSVAIPIREQDDPVLIQVTCTVKGLSVAPAITIFKDDLLVSKTLVVLSSRPGLPVFGKLKDFSSTVPINVNQSCSIACSYAIGTLHQEEQHKMRIELDLLPASPYDGLKYEEPSWSGVFLDTNSGKKYVGIMIAVLSIGAALILFASIANAIWRSKEHKRLKIRRRSLRLMQEINPGLHQVGEQKKATTMATPQFKRVTISESVEEKDPSTPIVMVFPAMNMEPRQSRHRLLSQMSKSEEILPDHLSLDDDVFEAPVMVRHESLPRGLNKQGKRTKTQSSSLLHLPTRLMILNVDGSTRGSFRLLREESVNSP